MKVIEQYQRAVENSDELLLTEVLAPQVRLETPAGPSANHPADTVAYILSQVAKTAPGIRSILAAAAGNDWHFLGFEGQIEGQQLQAIDQVHVNSDGKIDQSRYLHASDLGGPFVCGGHHAKASAQEVNHCRFRLPFVTPILTGPGSAATMATSSHTDQPIQSTTNAAIPKPAPVAQIIGHPPNAQMMPAIAAPAAPPPSGWRRFIARRPSV